MTKGRGLCGKLFHERGRTGGLSDVCDKDAGHDGSHHGRWHGIHWTAGQAQNEITGWDTDRPRNLPKPQG